MRVALNMLDTCLAARVVRILLLTACLCGTFIASSTCTIAVEPLDPALDPVNLVEVSGYAEVSAGLSSFIPGQNSVTLSVIHLGGPPATLTFGACSFVVLAYGTADRSGAPVWRHDAPDGENCSSTSKTTIKVSGGGVREIVLTSTAESQTVNPSTGRIYDLWLRWRAAGESRTREIWLTEPGVPD